MAMSNKDKITAQEIEKNFNSENQANLENDDKQKRNEETKAAQEIECNSNSENQAIVKIGNEKKRFADVSKPTSDLHKSGLQHVTNSSHGSHDRNHKNPEKSVIDKSKERQELVPSSETKKSNISRKNAQPKYGNSNANQKYAANGREQSVSVSGLKNEQSSSASINHNHSFKNAPKNCQSSSFGSGHAYSQNDLEYNYNQSLSSSSGSFTPSLKKKTTKAQNVYPQTYKFQEKQTARNFKNESKNQTKKFSGENTSQFPNKIILQKSNLNANSYGFVSNPNTNPVQQFPNISESMASQTPTTNIVWTSDQDPSTIQGQYEPTIEAEPMFMHHPLTAHTTLPPELIASNVVFNDDPHLILPETNLIDNFNELTIGMPYANDVISHTQEAAFQQPLLTTAPFQVQYCVPDYSPQHMITYESYTQVRMVKVCMVPQQRVMMPTLQLVSNNYYPTQVGQLNQIENGLSEIQYHQQVLQYNTMNQHLTDGLISNTTTWTTTNTWTVSNSDSFE